MNAIIPEIKSNWAEMPQLTVTFRDEERLEFVYELMDHCEFIAEEAEEEIIEQLFESGSIVVNGVTLTTRDIIKQFLRDSNYRDQYIAENKKFHAGIQAAYEAEMTSLEMLGCGPDHVEHDDSNRVVFAKRVY